MTVRRAGFFAVARQALELKPDDLNLYLLAIKALQDAGDSESAAAVAGGDAAYRMT